MFWFTYVKKVTNKFQISFMVLNRFNCHRRIGRRLSTTTTKIEIYISDCIKFRLSKVYLKHCDLGKEAVLILILDSATVLNTYYYLSYGKQILNPIISFVLQYLYETLVDRLYSKYLATDMSFWHKFHDGLSDIYIYKYTMIQDLKFLYYLDMMY